MDLRSLHLNLLFTPSSCAGGDPWRTLREALAGGVDLVQWRVKATSEHPLDRDPDALATCLATCREAGVALVVNDDVEAAVRVGAEGAHVGQDDLDAAEARRLLGPDRWLGVSTHGPEEIDRALAAGADYLGFGPLHPTETKGYTHCQPDGALRAAQERAGDVPVFGIGGLDAERVGILRHREGIRRAAVSRAILCADSPRAAAAAIRAALLAPIAPQAAPGE